MRWLLIILLLSSCIQDHREAYVDESLDTLENRISTDSLLMLADQIKKVYVNRQFQQRENMDSLQILLSQEVNLYNSTQQEYQNVQSQYQQQLTINEDLMKPTVRRRDSIVYNIRYIDTTIYRRDTIVIVDTIRRIFNKGWKK